MQNSQLQLPLECQLLHLTDRSVGSSNASAVGIEIQNDALAITAPAQLGDLLTAESGAQGGHCIRDTSGMQSNHIEVALHHNSTVVLADCG